MNNPPAIWLDGAPCTALPLPDRGLDFGDGLFETLLLRDGSPQYPELHLQRLQRGIQRLGFPDVTEQARSYLEQAATELSARSWPWASLRLTLTRGGGPRGYHPPAEQKPRFLITAAPIERDCARLMAPARVAVANIRWSPQPQLAGIKHLNRLEQVLAAQQVVELGVDDCVMLDQTGKVVSAVAGNLFALSDGKLLTPFLDRCGIAGTRRRLVLEKLGRKCGVDVREAELTPDDLLAAEEIFITNSLVGLRPVGSMDNRVWADHHGCRALFDSYLDEMR